MSSRNFTYGLMLLMIGIFSCRVTPQPEDLSWPVRMADSFLKRHQGNVTYDAGNPGEKWNYEQGLMLVALTRMYEASGNSRYIEFVKNNLDGYVTSRGMIRTYKLSDYNLDNIGPGRALLAVYNFTKDEKYRRAADTLRGQLRGQPRIPAQGFWHKKIYPDQMWLDGLFMAEPFYADYAVKFNEPSSFDDIANQFMLIAAHTFDPGTGLFYHGWDASRKERWANPATGCSESFWGRAMGWYAMGLIDVLDDIPRNHPKRDTLVAILQNLCSSLLKVRDSRSGLWYLIVNKGPENGNYLESSASCMFAYVFAKGATRGYLDRKYTKIAKDVFHSITSKFVTRNDDGTFDLHGTCGSAGLGGSPYRDGSMASYVKAGVQTNDLRGIGPFILAAIEIERATDTGQSE